ncbi:IS3 family transposase [Microbacterium sp. YY-01]|uniref:IS3 family transposase n=1 Tax=Microbacterium sp. YY-01 TaxID=3421634 RepID=UPI003D17DBA6
MPHLSGYRAGKPPTSSARQLYDELLLPEIERLHEKNFGILGVREMHAQLYREGCDIGRAQTARLIKLAGARGVRSFEKDPHDKQRAPVTLFVAPNPAR